MVNFPVDVKLYCKTCNKLFSSTILEDLLASLESGDENKALKVIAGTMNEEDLDLLEKESITMMVKDWIMPIATTVSAISMIILVLINYQNIIQK